MRRENVQSLLGGLEAPEPEKQINVVKDEHLEETLEKLSAAYKELLWMSIMTFVESGYALKTMKKLSKIDITPQAIFEFVSRLEQQSKEKDFPYKTSSFISALVQHSYDAGHNNFELYLENLNVCYLCSDLVGRTQNPIRLKLINGSGSDWFQKAKNLDVQIIGDADGLALIGTYLCNFEVSGSVGEYGARGSLCSNFRLLGDVSKNFGLESTACNFIHRSESVLDSIRKVAGKGNKYYLLKDGKEIPYNFWHKLKKRFGR